MRYKGRYVAQLVIDFDIEKREGVLPFDAVKKAVTEGELTDAIKEVIFKEFTEDYGTVTVTQQYADLYKVDENDCG